MKVALLQYPIAWADKTTNLRLTEERIAALAGKADVAVLPEMFATGFCTNQPELAETMDGEIMTTLQRLADQYEIAIVGSFICIGSRRKGLARILPPKLVNRGFMVVPHGEVQIQDKRHLYAHGGEDKFFEQANERNTFEYKGVKIQLLVCYDLRFPAFLYNRAQYDVLLISANFPDSRLLAWDTLVRARAIENICYVAASNRVGADEYGTYKGHSVILNPYGQTLAACNDNEQGSATAALDDEMLQKIRVMQQFNR